MTDLTLERIDEILAGLEGAKARFEASYIPEPMSGCWLWLGQMQAGKKCYGNFFAVGRYWRAHRYSYIIHRGRLIEPDTLVCHHCDNPACVNPDHLFLGTYKDNSDDKVRKGRHMRGEAIPTAKLTADDVRAIRASPLGPTEIANQYGIKRLQARLVKNGQAWRHVQ